MINNEIYNKNILLKKALEYMNSNFQKNITLKDVALHTYTSKSYLSSFFQKNTGVSMSCYLNHLKIEKAKSLLLSSNYSLDYISYLCGFTTQNYFSYVFKKHENITPLKYRLQNK